MEKGYIYKLELNKDLDSFKKGEVYIGKHNGVKSEYYASGELIKSIKQKYSNDVFDREIIAKDIEDEKLRCYLEIYYINLYKCNRSITGIGLNLTNGGEGLSGYKMTDKHKAKIISSIEESYKKGRRAPKLKQVHKYSLDTGEYIETFERCSDAAKSCKLKSPSSIAYCARGKCLSVGGFSWSYKKKDRLEVDAFKRKRVMQYDLNGNFIKEYLSLYHASQSVKTSVSSISNCCNGRTKTSMKFKWKFKE